MLYKFFIYFTLSDYKFKELSARVLMESWVEMDLVWGQFVQSVDR